MFAMTVCCDAKKDVSARIESLCRVLWSIQLGGGRFVGFQPGATSGVLDYFAFFNDPLTGDTLSLPIAEVTVERVREKVTQNILAHSDLFGSLFGVAIFLGKINPHRMTILNSAQSIKAKNSTA